LITTKAVNVMKPKGFGVTFNANMQRGARRYVGDIKVDYEDAIDKIEERVLNKL